MKLASTILKSYKHVLFKRDKPKVRQYMNEDYVDPETGDEKQHVFCQGAKDPVISASDIEVEEQKETRGSYNENKVSILPKLSIGTDSLSTVDLFCGSWTLTYIKPSWLTIIM